MKIKKSNVLYKQMNISLIHEQIYIILLKIQWNMSKMNLIGYSQGLAIILNALFQLMDNQQNHCHQHQKKWKQITMGFQLNLSTRNKLKNSGKKENFEKMNKGAEQVPNSFFQIYIENFYIY
eukprot:TRINITY_DN5902_c0_g2_i16.p2 TRINITY_DN5902_c0_g2~~TRINITY_DN5902_c0_g2_i16.p2  ORF type:complete len:122 (-),score=12.01 TRINITY_DN5902_c0_g2_i16:112-477(-)